MKDNLFLLLLLICGKINSHAQLNDGFSKLQEGKIVPNVYLGKVVSVSEFLPKTNDSIYLSDLKGRLVILDFWTAFCGNCIKEFPKLFELQNLFGHEIIILPIGLSTQLPTGNIKGDIGKLVNSWKTSYKELKLSSTMIVERFDQFNDLRKLFPFNSVPTLVWIDRDGRFIKMTGPRAVTKENINDILKGKQVLFRPKKMTSIVSPTENFLINRASLHTKTTNIFKFYPYSDTLSACMIRMDTLQTDYYHFYAVNNSILDLYLGAFSYILGNRDIKLSKRRVHLKGFKNENKQKLDIFYNTLIDDGEIGKFLSKNYTSFELFVPKKNLSVIDAYKTMVDIINNKYGISAEVTLTTQPCLIVSKGSNWLGSYFIHENEFKLERDDKYFRFIGDVESFLEFINNKLSYNFPLIINKDTSLKYINANLPVSSFRNVESLVKGLRENGLKVSLMNINIEALELKQKK